MNKIGITLDPGHVDGYNKGVISSYCEGNAMFKLAYFMKDYLEATGLFTVYITRQKVTDNPTLAARGKMAITNGSKIFISLHSNAFSDGSAHGTLAFYSCVRPNSLALGKLLSEGIANTIKTATAAGYSRGCMSQKNASGSDYWGVIRAAAASARVEYIYLIEHGFHTNMAECKFLNTDDGLKKIAKAESDILYKYFSGSSTVNTTPVATQPTTLSKGSQYVLSSSTPGYLTADSAKNKVSQKTTVAPGTYYVYGTYGGMINITKSVGGVVPGAWINPTNASNSSASSSAVAGTQTTTPVVNTPTSKLTAITMSALNMPKCTPEQAIAHIKSMNPNPRLTCSLEELVYSFIRAGYIENIRWDIALAQSLVETGYFKYGGAVLYTQNNFAGIGSVSASAHGAVFASPFIGAMAQMQHLKAYANASPIEWKNIIDPRFTYVARGKAPYVEWLGAATNPNTTKTTSVGWAIPGTNYGATILGVLAKMASTKI